MAIDPYYEKMTVSGQMKRQIVAAWPVVYKLINGLFTILASALMAMIKSALNAFKPR